MSELKHEIERIIKKMIKEDLGNKEKIGLYIHILENIDIILEKYNCKLSNFWIPCSDLMPIAWDRVLVKVSSGFVHIASWSEEGILFSSDSEEKHNWVGDGIEAETWSDKEIIGWRPLPC